MHIIGTIIIGFIIGLIARALMPGKDPAGFIKTTVLGIVGALLARWIGQMIGWYGPEDPAGFFASVTGALIVLGVYSRVVRRGGRGEVTS